MNVLELFAGSRSIGKVAESMGMSVFSTDVKNWGQIDHVADIRDFNPACLPFEPNIIWASPPCESFSVAAIGKNWNHDGTPKNERARLGIALVEKTLEIIRAFPNAIYFIENPRGMLRKMPQMGGLPRRTVSYCQYGDTRMKPTDIWTNCRSWKPRPMCAPRAGCHEPAPRGARTGTQGLKNAHLRAVIPTELCNEVLRAALMDINGM